MKHKSSADKNNNRRMGKEFCPQTKSLLPPALASPLSSLPPSHSLLPLLLDPSLYPSLSGILSLSLARSCSLSCSRSRSVSPPPLRASCRGSWFTPPCLGLSESCERLLFRSVTADREQLTQGQGERRESRVTLSSAQPSRNQSCIPAEREGGEKRKPRHRQERTAAERVTARDK